MGGELNRTTTANLFMLFLLAYNIALAILFSYLHWDVLRDTAHAELLMSPWFRFVIQVLGLILPLLIFAQVTNTKSEVIGPLQRHGFSLANGILIAAISIFLQPLMMLISAFTSLFIPNPVSEAMTEIVAMPIPLALLLVAVTPAICEEIVFRGYIQSAYREQPIFIMALVNGIFFGIIHLNMHQFSYALIMGIIFAYMVYITKSIYAAMLSHFIINGMQVLLGYFILGQEVAAGEYASEPYIWEAISMLLVINLFTAPVLVFLFRILRDRNTESKTDENKEEAVKHPFDGFFFAVIILFGIFMLALL